MLVEVRVAYRASEDRRRPFLGDDIARYASFRTDVVQVSDDVAPVAFAYEQYGRRQEYRKHAGRLYKADMLSAEHPENSPLPILWYCPGSFISREEALPESAAEAKCGGKWRLDGIAAAKRWASTALIGHDGNGVLSAWSPTLEPVIVVSPPGDKSFMRRGNKVPVIHIILCPLDHDREVLFGALCQDRVFRLDEEVDARRRARDFGERIYSSFRFDVRDAGCFSIEPSTMALRLTAGEAIAASPRIRQADFSTAKRALKAVIDDPDANAAAICPRVRSFLAAFGATGRLHDISKGPEMAPVLDRLERAHARAQRRMAECRIPDRDARELAPQDEAAVASLGI